jgi:acetylornithine deacetylase/succinyl-diaminopimelate desuccinylase-like protein
MAIRWTVALAIIACCSLPPSFAATNTATTQADATQAHALAREIFRELIEIDTTQSKGSVTKASEAMAKRLRDAGFPGSDLAIVGDVPNKKNLVVRLHGTGRHKPILLIGHLDVVEAKREDWTTNPFEFVEKDGYFYGRGTQDMKGGDAIMVTTLIRFRKEGFRPDRDIIVALTADEESGDANGVQWLFTHRRDLVDAEFVFNHDDTAVVLEQGRPRRYEMAGTEKVYADYQFVATNPGGHSSLPVPDNAIYELSDALERLKGYRFPFELNSITRGYFERMAGITVGETAADMKGVIATPPDTAAIDRLSKDKLYNSMMRTTCVATRLEGGHANNALPQRAIATVNCRILPGHSAEEVRQELAKVVADPRIAVRFINAKGVVMDTADDRRGFPPPPLRPEVMKPLEKLVAEMWSGSPVIPTMAVGASDDVYVTQAGLPSYILSGLAVEKGDERAHGQDERIGVKSFNDGVDFLYRYLKLLTGQ